MFLEKYLDEFYYELILDYYKTGYLNMLDENNFNLLCNKVLMKYRQHQEFMLQFYC